MNVIALQRRMNDRPVFRGQPLIDVAQEILDANDFSRRLWVVRTFDLVPVEWLQDIDDRIRDGDTDAAAMFLARWNQTYRRTVQDGHDEVSTPLERTTCFLTPHLSDTYRFRVAEYRSKMKRLSKNISSNRHLWWYLLHAAETPEIARTIHTRINDDLDTARALEVLPEAWFVHNGEELLEHDAIVQLADADNLVDYVESFYEAARNRAVICYVKD